MLDIITGKQANDRSVYFGDGVYNATYAAHRKLLRISYG